MFKWTTNSFTSQLSLTQCPVALSAARRWLQLRFDFDSTAVRLLIKGH